MFDASSEIFRKKVIGLDDLFNDHKKEQLKKKKEKSRGVKGPKVVDSDDDDVNETANKLSEVLDDFKKTVYWDVLFGCGFLLIMVTYMYTLAFVDM